MDEVHFVLVEGQTASLVNPLLYRCQTCSEMRSGENILVHAIFAHQAKKAVIDLEEAA